LYTGKEEQTEDEAFPEKDRVGLFLKAATQLGGGILPTKRRKHQRKRHGQKSIRKG